ncbi:MAG: vanadium-dependent haloperoxidase [Acidobacteriia bacterium]|nr:vanadium-dependent haloperoxidase [Terriglobia bacterium]
MNLRKLVLALPLACVCQVYGSNVITDWNTMASTAIVTTGGNAPGASAVWFAYSSIAVYDAVNAITGHYEPFYYRLEGPSNASTEAAAVAAAHRVLVNYFPAQQAALDSQYMTSLAAITADQASKDAGTAVGEAAARELIRLRTGDGLLANITYTPGSGPGAWIPTPPSFSPPVTPWLGQMRPFTLRTAADYLPDPPPSLSSETWQRDYNLTRIYGGTTSDVRSAAEGEIGIYWTENTAGQYARMLNYLVNNYNLGLEDSARLMAMVWTGFADSAIGCYNAKYKYGFWRPVTAIPAGGGNPNLTADSSWMPLGVTPSHPEYPAAHACITGAVTPLVANFFGTTHVHVVTDSKAFAAAIHTHTFEDTRDWLDEVFWARIYAGFHFHHSLEVGSQLGESVANHLIRNYFHTVSSPR